MEKSVASVLTEAIKKETWNRFELEDNYTLLGDFENYVYEVYKKGKSYILRLTHSSHRNHVELLAEMNWVTHLFNSDLQVPRIYASKDGRFVETVQAEDQSYFYASLFDKVKGSPVKIDSEQFNTSLFRAWGNSIGQMHAATKDFQLAPDLNRKTWEQDELLFVERYIPVYEDKVIANAKDLINQIKKLPITKENYGLIHNDVHSGNFFYDGTNIHIFDFDDSCYMWFVSDIAIPVYYTVMAKHAATDQEKRNQFAAKFLTAFMDGYKEANQAPADWEIHLPYFLRLRDVTLYTVLHKKIDKTERSDKVLELLSELRDRIEQNQSIVEFR
ncbi:phosphotransferase enzyme family protein [Radiobacillus sp. PE A8.2]|uniref:phosphotransferase enzyme family protein n=1 Tax=Radiobacillus sp. PE A8.2 TaxID=3380349 RepID=UPI00388D33B3